MKPAAEAIDAACVMLGSFTRYQSMNEPRIVSDARRHARRGKKSRAAVDEPAAEQAVEETRDADRLPVRIRRAVGR
jgi:hypothetical protein